MWDSFDGSLKKSFFVCQSGIVAATPISSEDSFALAGHDNNIYLFSFFTGTTPQQFYAHDDTITAMCFKKDKLISCSIDQTIKIWSLESAQGFKNAEKTLYDHEEEIIAAVVCPHPDVHLLATADVDGQIIVRDLAEPDTPMCHIRPDLEYEPPECVSILFNQ